MWPQAQRRHTRRTANRSLFGWLRLKLLDATWRLERSQLRNLISSEQSPLGAQRRDQFEIFERESELLRSHLRAVPYWSNGHYQLGQRALALGQTHLAYACAQIVIQLDRSDTSRGELLLAQALGRAGQHEEALLKLRRLRVRDNSSIVVIEELGVILSAQGNFDEALELLISIPHHRRSAEVSSAIIYLQGKLDTVRNRGNSI